MISDSDSDADADADTDGETPFAEVFDNLDLFKLISNVATCQVQSRLRSTCSFFAAIPHADLWFATRDDIIYGNPSLDLMCKRIGIPMYTPAIISFNKMIAPHLTIVYTQPSPHRCIRRGDPLQFISVLRANLGDGYRKIYDDVAKERSIRAKVSRNASDCDAMVKRIKLMNKDLDELEKDAIDFQKEYDCLKVRTTSHLDALKAKRRRERLVVKKKQKMAQMLGAR